MELPTFLFYAVLLIALQIILYTHADYVGAAGSAMAECAEDILEEGPRYGATRNETEPADYRGNRNYSWGGGCAPMTHANTPDHAEQTQ